MSRLSAPPKWNREGNSQRMLSEDFKQNITVTGPLFPGARPGYHRCADGQLGQADRKGVRSSKVYEPILSTEQLAQLQSSPDQEPFDGDPARFRLGVEAMRLGLPMNTTHTSRSQSRASTRCPTNLKRSTSISSSCRASAFCWPTIPAPAKRSWPACSSRS